MPKTEVVLFAEADNRCPLVEWLDSLPPKAQLRCIVKIERLSEMGHELRRPEADYLDDKIYELRVALQGVQYRMLYFFHENKAVITHGLEKEKRVPPKEIALAVSRRDTYVQNPLAHTHREEKP